MEKVRYFKQHTFVFLTKYPENLIKRSPFSDNCWVGASIDFSTFNKMTDRFGVSMTALGEVEAKVKFISFEPLLDWHWRDGWMDLQDYLEDRGINWVIIGCETFSGKPVKAHLPKIEWMKEIVEACDKAKLPVFLKNNLSNILPTAEWSRMPCSNSAISWNIRQELPILGKSEV